MVNRFSSFKINIGSWKHTHLIFLNIYPSIYLPSYIHTCIGLSQYLSIYPSIYLFVCLSSYLFIYIYISTCLYKYYLCMYERRIYQQLLSNLLYFIYTLLHALSLFRIYVSLCISMYLYVSMYLCIYVFMHLCIYVSMYLCIYLSIYLCINMHLCI